MELQSKEEEEKKKSKLKNCIFDTTFENSLRANIYKMIFRIKKNVM